MGLDMEKLKSISSELISSLKFLEEETKEQGIFLSAMIPLDAAIYDLEDLINGTLAKEQK